MRLKVCSTQYVYVAHFVDLQPYSWKQTEIVVLQRHGTGTA